MSCRFASSVLSIAMLLTTSLAVAQDEAIAVAVATEEAAEGSDIAETETAIRPLTVAARLTDGSILTGTLLDSNSLAIKTAFGEASLPLSEVAGVRFPTGDDSATTAVMLNGDSITGATDMKFINVETTWGSAKINGQAIADLMFVPGLEWKSADALGGRRWTLTEKTPRTQNQQPSGPQSNRFGGQPNRTTAPAPQNRVARPGNLPTPAPQIIYGR